jgi:hypothetical protein
MELLTAAAVVVPLFNLLPLKEQAAQVVAVMAVLGQALPLRVFKVVRQGLQTQAAVAEVGTQAVLVL